MGNLTEEFISDLAAIQARYQRNPQHEFDQLLLLALEREELVSIAYRKARLDATIDQIPISDIAKEIVRSALIWIWKDEQMHTTYVRSVLSRSTRRISRWRILIVQFVGTLGGWSSSVIQHSNWKSAPFSRTLSKLILAAGSITGKVPAAVASRLDNTSFRGFCELNVEAEVTAQICWRRISELAREIHISSEKIRDFEQITNDEENHRRIFSLLTEVENTSPELLLDRISGIGKYFLPFRYRAERDPLSKSDSVWCISGRHRESKFDLFKHLLIESNLLGAIASNAKEIGKSPEQMRIVIKAPFMMIYDRSDISPVIDTDLLAQLIQYLVENGFNNLALLERGNIYEHFQSNRSVKQVAKYLRLDELPVEIVDCKDDQVPHQYPRGLGLATISSNWRDADFRISFGKLRSHPSDHAVLTVANMEGLGPRWDDYIFFERSVDFASAQATMVSAFPPDFAILDAFSKTPDGMVGVMGHPKARDVNRLYSSANALALDQTVMRHLGIDLQDSSILRELLYWRGENKSNAEVHGEDSPIDHWRGPHSSDICEFLGLFSILFYEYTGRGSLFVPKFDSDAFPSIEPQAPGLNLLRHFVRTMISFQFVSRNN